MSKSCADLVQESADNTLADLAMMYLPWDQAEEDKRAFLEDHGADSEGDLDTQCHEVSYDYGLGIDYVVPGTFEDQNEGYWRYQFSCGGPSTELRLYASGPDQPLYRAEYWYLDWFDGASVDVTASPAVAAMWEQWQEIDLPLSKYQEAAE